MGIRLSLQHLLYGQWQSGQTRRGTHTKVERTGGGEETVTQRETKGRGGEIKMMAGRA